jgi:hypothetical protein
MKFKIIVLLFLSLVTTSLQAQGEPLYEFRSVDDILAANAFGSLSLKVNYIDGEEVFREYTISTSTGYEVNVNVNLSTKTTYLYTPDSSIKIVQNSSINFTYKDLQTGQVQTVWEPSGGFPEAPSIASQSFTEPWAQDIQLFLLALESDGTANPFSVLHPLGKADYSGYVTESHCNVSTDCKWALGGAVLGPFSVAFCAPHPAAFVSCPMAVAFFARSLYVSLTDCARCEAYQSPEDPNEPADPGIPGEMCSGVDCSNRRAIGNQGTGAIVCEDWDTGHTRDDNPPYATYEIIFCARYGLQP